jgi:hypothetical protein
MDASCWAAAIAKGLAVVMEVEAPSQAASITAAATATASNARNPLPVPPAIIILDMGGAAMANRERRGGAAAV